MPCTNTMTFTECLLASRQLRNTQKTVFYPPSSFEMAFFSSQPKSQYLNPPPPLSRKPSKSILHDDIDDFLSSDLEASFASSVSVSSPTREHPSHSRAPMYEPMDISPAPPPKPAQRLSSLHQDVGLKPQGRPRALTSGARLFGNDLSNTTTLAPSPTLAPEPSLKPSSGAKKTQRSALPMEWFTQSQAPALPQPTPPPEPSSPADDAMDVDTSYNSAQPSPAAFSHCVPHSAAPTITTFSNLFFDTISPRRSLDSSPKPHIKKRRSFSPEPVRSFERDGPSSPMPIDRSPSAPRQDSVPDGSLSSRLPKPTLLGLGAPSASFAKRPRKPVVSAVVSSTDASHFRSTLPVLKIGDYDEEESNTRGVVPVRRAFSALLPPSQFLESFSDESSFDGPDMSSPAQAYSKRQQVKTLRRCDGTEDFKPLTGGVPSTVRDSPSSRFVSPGLPGFGDNEAHGKILPCHRVREDGLMRINTQTMDTLLGGKYDSQIVDYHIIDCRFDYEYAGGHIQGAVNINTTAAVEELLLGPSLTKPRPSISGDSTRKTILVFHCEFSAKRAPTFAKHLRAKDRAMNNHVYPKIHFPEVYILEGGYCQYYRTSSHRCEPRGYVTMDDPTHAASRREDLDQFRKAKFGRHKSYAYGDGLGKSASSQQPKRNTAPTGQNPVFAAANAARTRRGGGGGLMTLPEDNSGTADADDTDVDLGDSPCPPPTKAAALKSKKMTGRLSLTRAETYNPMRLGY